MRILVTGRRIWRMHVIRRRARRDYRALCDQGRAPRVSVHIRLETDHGDDWTGMSARGLYGVKTGGVPLTPDGIRYIAKIPRDIRKTCIRELVRDLAGDKESA